MDQRLQDVNSHDGFNKSIGVKIIDWQDGAGTVTLTPDLNHTNPAGLIHGGVLMSMLDVVLALTGSYDPPPLKLMPGLTLTLNTQFIKAATPEEGVLTAVAKKTGGGKTIFFAEGEIRTADGHVIATATGVFKKGRQPNAKS